MIGHGVKRRLEGVGSFHTVHLCMDESVDWTGLDLDYGRDSRYDPAYCQKRYVGAIGCTVLLVA